MNAATRSALATVTATLTSAGFKAQIPTGRQKRPGFGVRAMPAIFLFDYTNGNGEFPRMCEALQAAGYTLTDAQGGQNFVQYGAARVSK